MCNCDLRQWDLQMNNNELEQLPNQYGEGSGKLPKKVSAADVNVSLRLGRR